MTGKNYIFVIAIDKYENASFPSLNNAKLDAERFIKVVTEKYGFELIQDSLYDADASRKKIIEAINHLTSFLTPDDTIIIYYAGHGEINPKTKRGYWIPSDATKSVSDYISNSTVIESIEGIDAKHILLISDSCFSGTFLAQSRFKAETHYSKLEEIKSRWFLGSGRLELVSDGQPGIGSPFSISLNRHLENNEEKLISFLEIATKVSKETGNSSKQQPILAHIQAVGHEGGEIVFKIIDEQFEKEKDEELTRISVSIETAKKLQSLGFPQKSIFGYYSLGKKIVLKKVDTSDNFICSAYIFDEITDFIPEDIEVDNNTYLARNGGYDKLKIKKWEYPSASIYYQKTHVIDTPCMAICRCNGRMVAFSMTDDGKYNNLITWGSNQAEAAGLMLIALFEENKIELT